MKGIFLVVTVLLSLFNCLLAQSDQSELIDNFFEKESVNILVTDSGLGGMSVAANLYENIKNAGIFKKVTIKFFNAQPDLKLGYNSMKSTEEKIWVFNNALNAMNEKLKPDIILIACNTLSVIYEYTEFSKNAVIPVIGIIEAGIDLINSKLSINNDSKVIIFATKTTVNQGKHKRGLLDLGIDEERIITIACPRLAGSIERGYEGRETDSLLNVYVQEGINQLEGTAKNVYVSYNCTHYGYITEQFAAKFDAMGIQVNDYLNPNYNMTNFIFNAGKKNRFEKTDISIEIISQSELTPDKIYSIYSLLEKKSEAAAAALLYYNFYSDFFEWHYKSAN